MYGSDDEPDSSDDEEEEEEPQQEEKELDPIELKRKIKRFNERQEERLDELERQGIFFKFLLLLQHDLKRRSEGPLQAGGGGEIPLAGVFF